MIGLTELSDGEDLFASHDTLWCATTTVERAFVVILKQADCDF